MREMFLGRGIKMDESFVAIIPVRENEDGELVNKDCLPFSDSDLLTYKIRQLKKIPKLNIVVTTDSDKLTEIALKENVSVNKRPRNLAKKDASFGELVRYVCAEVTEKNILWACVTSPLVDEKVYENAIDVYKEKVKKGFDSLVSVQKLQRYLMDINGALNFRTDDFKAVNKLPELYIFTNGISIAPREKMIEWKYTSGDMPYLYELTKQQSIDICDTFDYECAKKFLND